MPAVVAAAAAAEVVARGALTEARRGLLMAVAMACRRLVVDPAAWACRPPHLVGGKHRRTGRRRRLRAAVVAQPPDSRGSRATAVSGGATSPSYTC